jgi:hypothetical protein
VQDVAQDVDRERVGHRVGSEPGDAFDVVRVADDVQGEALAGAGLGDVETAAVVQDDPGGER